MKTQTAACARPAAKKARVKKTELTKSRTIVRIFRADRIRALALTRACLLRELTGDANVLRCVQLVK